MKTWKKNILTSQNFLAKVTEKPERNDTISALFTAATVEES